LHNIRRKVYGSSLGEKCNLFDVVLESLPLPARF
jgi:hypothetical protein